MCFDAISLHSNGKLAAPNKYFIHYNGAVSWVKMLKHSRKFYKDGHIQHEQLELLRH